jgi:DNA-directed RNA polymerase specialized sigma24 family protein
MSGFFASPKEVIWALLTYTDWWQPATASIIQVGAARRGNSLPEGLRPGLLETLDERTELSRRVRMLGDRDRRVLFLWYVRQLEVRDIARDLRISRRQCFRLRANAVREIVKLGEPDEPAEARSPGTAVQAGA